MVKGKGTSKPYISFISKDRTLNGSYFYDHQIYYSVYDLNWNELKEETKILDYDAEYGTFFGADFIKDNILVLKLYC